MRRPTLTLPYTALPCLTLDRLALLAERSGCELWVQFRRRSMRCQPNREEVMMVATKKPTPKAAPKKAAKKGT